MVLIEHGLVPELLVRVFMKLAIAFSVVSMSCNVLLDFSRCDIPI